jgi:hypothetical protein
VPGEAPPTGLLARHSLPALAAFGVGCSAGVLSAPCQTMNALMKSEAHRGVPMSAHISRFFEPGVMQGVHRLYFGALTRSVRCGGAGVLYYSYRQVFHS